MKISTNKRLYISDAVKGNSERILKKIEKAKLQKGIFVMSIANEQNQLIDIAPAYIYLQPYYKDKCIQIVGLAASKSDGINLLEKMILDCYKSGNEYNLKAYFSQAGWR